METELLVWHEDDLEVFPPHTRRDGEISDHKNPFLGTQESVLSQVLESEEVLEQAMTGWERSETAQQKGARRI